MLSTYNKKINMTLTAKRAKYTPMSQRIIFCFAVVGLFLKPQ